MRPPARAVAPVPLHFGGRACRVACRSEQAPGHDRTTSDAAASRSGMIAPEPEPRPKPRLRGWSHAIACGVAMLSTIALCARGGDEIARLLSLAVYGASTILLFGASAAYHLGAWHGARRAALRSLDRASIFILIAGTFTPFCVTLLSGTERALVLALIRGLAGLGVAS